MKCRINRHISIVCHGYFQKTLHKSWRDQIFPIDIWVDVHVHGVDSRNSVQYSLDLMQFYLSGVLLSLTQTKMHRTASPIGTICLRKIWRQLGCIYNWIKSWHIKSKIADNVQWKCSHNTITIPRCNISYFYSCWGSLREYCQIRSKVIILVLATLCKYYLGQDPIVNLLQQKSYCKWHSTWLVFILIK